MSDTDTDDEVFVDDAETTYEPNPAERGKWISAIIALVGVWLVVEPFVLGVLPGNFWNDIIVGIALIAIGGYNYYRRADDRLASVAAAGLAALLGLWLMVAPFVYDVDVGFAELTTELGFWNDVIVGLIVLVLGAYSIYDARDVDAPAATEQ